VVIFTKNKTMSLMFYDNRIDKSKDVVDSLIAISDGHKLHDRDFDSVCEAYELDEEKVMWKMIRSDKYKFNRADTGWYIEPKE